MDVEGGRPLGETVIEETGGTGAKPRLPEAGEVPASRDGGWSGGPVPEGRPGPEWSFGGTEQAWTPAEKISLPAAPGLGELEWAERADRAFRRDSRRYDGGFYLY